VTKLFQYGKIERVTPYLTSAQERILRSCINVPQAVQPAATVVR